MYQFKDESQHMPTIKHKYDFSDQVLNFQDTNKQQERAKNNVSF